MADRILPTLRLAVLCRQVTYDENPWLHSLVEPVHTVLAPPGWDGASGLRALYLYLQLADAVGAFEVSAELRDEGGEPRYRSAATGVVFDGTANRAVPRDVVLRLDGMKFPGPGLYELHVRCGGASLHDPRQPIPVPYPPVRVSVLPADEPAGGGDGDQT